MRFLEHLLQEGLAKRTYRGRGKANLTEREVQALTKLLARGIANNAAHSEEVSAGTPGYNFTWQELLTDDEAWEQHLMEVTDLVYDEVRVEYKKIMERS